MSTLVIHQVQPISSIGDGNSWEQQHKFTAADGAADDLFGNSVALKGNTVLVGVPGADSGSNEDQGKAFFFQRQPYELFLPLIVR